MELSKKELELLITIIRHYWNDITITYGFLKMNKIMDKLQMQYLESFYQKEVKESD